MQLNPNAIKRMQTGVEPDVRAAGTPLEAIQALKRKEMEQNQAQQPPAPPREYVTVDGHRVPKDFFTCLTMCIIKLNDKGVNDILSAFGFKMQDADGKVLFPQPPVEKKPKKKNGKNRRS